MANPEFRKTILIGLGGAGQQIVLRAKRFFLDTYGVLPPSIKILCMDTDDEALKLCSALRDRDCVIEPQEFLHLKVPDPRGFIDATPDIQKWYVKPVPVGAITRGAGAVRQNGRLAFFCHINEIIRRIDGLFSSLNDTQLETRMNTAEREGSNTAFNLSRREMEIYVCGSLAGGTGSGTFLDMGLLLRHLHPQTLIHGFFLLPWVYRNKAFAYRVFQNTYAALAELDNLQSIMYGDKHFIPYQKHYADVTVKADRAPYDLCHLIDGRNEYDENIDNVEALCETIANALFLSMGAMSLKVASVTDNLLGFINVANPQIWDGRYARYSSLGVSSIHYPAQELHRLLAAQNALGLCATAIRQIETGGSAGEAAAARQRIAQDVDSFIKQLNLYRINVRAHLCPDQAPISLMLENFEIADPDFPAQPKAKFDGEKKSLEQNLQAGFEGQGRVFIESLLQNVDRRLKALAADPRTDSATRREWGAGLVDHLRRLLDETAQERVQTDQQVKDLQASADQRLEIALKSRYLPLLGGHRKRAALLWAEDAGQLLTAFKARINLGHEQECYETLLQRAETDAAIAVPTASEIVKALIETEGELRNHLAREDKNLAILRARPNHVLLGYGHVAVVPRHAEKAITQMREGIVLAYEKFIQDSAIHTPEDYLRRYRQGPSQLTALFSDYCERELAYLTSITIDQALETLAEESGDPPAFKARQFDHLFCLSSALWSFDRGRITPDRAGQMDKIINLGFFNQEHNESAYSKLAEDARARFHIRTNLAYSSTGDSYHIWMLNYSATLPAYLLAGLRNVRNSYYEQITPTYHVDSYFEMNVPDLFPVGELDNRVLRALGLAIVPGIEVIRDEKLQKGHRFTFDDDSVRVLNYDDPKVWRLFRDMYEEFKDHYNPRRTDNLFDLLIHLLREKVGAMSRDELRTCIERYIAKVHKKLDERDFSRLISARLTYREIRALEDFLAKPPHGYAMDFDRYLAGDLG